MKTKNYKSVLCALFAGISLAANCQSIGEIRGVIKDKDDLQPIPYANIKILQDGQLIGGAQTDIDGRYNYKPLVPGTYELMVTEPGHKTQPVNKVKIIPNEATYVDIKMSANAFGTVIVTADPIDYTKTGVDKVIFNVVSLDAEELNRNASYTRGDIKGALEAMTSDVVSTGDGEVHFRGSRGDASGYFVDGVRTLRAASVPGLSIENLSVFPGGVPAMYGDLQSGVVIITTMGYFSGIREKNVRLASRREAKEEESASKKAKEDEEKRAKEIEEEKAKEKKSKSKG
ncbi:hypothetical protein CNR22_04945 [Sphingobacteriaceae bacterium]|nr:hypothetical protein CNR22_04945 [Sphingobacteriaceae bacterium]